ncbi:MAG: hypothetical protein U5S82_17270 [Gammaproteobacteria bacterium]|nr:hypothetical protein [Gammaproteobacteria bacterium]
MQLRFKTTLSSREYVTHQAWRDAALERCPLHPDGGCSFARHGTYGRVEPPGTRIPRWYCPEGHRTFSLLADCLASRLPGSVSDLERVVIEVEQARSLEAAADSLRTDDISLPAAIRWTRRRVQRVHTALRILFDLIPECLCGCQPTVSALRQWLGVEWVLPEVREIAAMYLGVLPSPVGFASPQASANHGGQIQHDKGPDPPPGLR